MATTTTRLGLDKPAYADAADIAVLNQNFDDIDNAVGMKVVTSTTRPATPWNGQIIFETDTNFTLVWDSTGAAWKQIGGAATVCTSSTRPASPLNGQLIYETDTRNLFVYNTSGAAWRLPIQYFRPANAAGLAAITGMVSGDNAYQIDTNVEYLYNGSSWVQSYPPVITGSLLPAGSILQVVYGSTTTGVTSSSSTYADTGVTATITPSSASSQILVLVSHSGVGKSSANVNNSADIRTLRGATQISINPSLGFTGTTIENRISTSFVVLDSPSTTSATTYKTQIRNAFNGASVYTLNGATHSIALLEVRA